MCVFRAKYAPTYRQPAVLEFYEQGIERTLLFSPAGDDYEVGCESFGQWQPNPALERVRQSDLLSMLQTY